MTSTTHGSSGQFTVVSDFFESTFFSFSIYLLKRVVVFNLFCCFVIVCDSLHLSSRFAYFRYTTPVPVLPGDMLKLTCEYNTMGVRNDVTWGMGPNQEICKTILIYYPKENWHDHHCESFKNIPLCALEIGDAVFGCTYRGFMLALTNDPGLYDLSNCAQSASCSDECLQKTKAARSSACLSGDMYDLWKLMAKSLRDPKLITLYKALVICEERYTSSMFEGRSQRGRQ